MTDSSQETEDTPAVRLGRQLRRIRLAAGYTTHLALAKRIGFAEDAIQKAETGKRVPSEAVFPAILGACATTIDGKHRVLTDGERELLTELWEVARKESGPIPEFIELYLRREKKAEYLLLWCSAVISGLLQIYDYAYAMFTSADMDEDEASEKATARSGRRAVLDGAGAAHVTALLHESVLYCQVGTPETMVKQLTDLLEISRRRNVIVQVVRGSEYFFGLETQFEIASGDEIPHTLVTYAVEDQTLDDKAAVRKAIALFKEIQGRALTTEESRALIAEAVEKWKSLQQQQ